MNNNPNSHEPLIDSALIGLDLSAEHHLAHCPCCQGEREKTEQALRQFAELEREQASRSEDFWEEQTARIRAARISLARRASPAPILVPALALLLVLGLAITPRRQPPTRPTPTQEISDHDLLVAVERAVDNGTPYALEPVALVADDTESSSAVPNKNVPQKNHKKMIEELDSHAQ
jgi:hypothetical protein